MHSGRLYYDGEENYIEVRRFIEHGDSAVIDLTTTWDDLGLWFAAVALDKNGDHYTSPVFDAINQANNSTSSQAKITLTIKERLVNSILIEGAWYEDGETQYFSGELALQG